MKRFLRSFAFYFTLFVFTLFAIFPALWAVLTIFKKSSDLYTSTANPFLYHPEPTLEHLKYLFTNTNFTTFVSNSAIIGVAVVVITLLLSVPAAYA
ncbi:MAG: carbohydrate ABC transporter permease, partial [Gammaproteobacteria bacterium]